MRRKPDKRSLKPCFNFIPLNVFINVNSHSLHYHLRKTFRLVLPLILLPASIWRCWLDLPVFPEVQLYESRGHILHLRLNLLEPSRHGTSHLHLRHLNISFPSIFTLSHLPTHTCSINPLTVSHPNPGLDLPSIFITTTSIQLDDGEHVWVGSPSDVEAQARRLPLPSGYENLSDVPLSYAVSQRTQM
jgi:hypothetical protein